MASSGADDAILADAASQSQTSDRTSLPDSVREDEKNACNSVGFPPLSVLSFGTVLGSLTAPDLVICKVSPEIHVERFLQDTPESITKRPRRNRICFKDDLPEKVMGEPRAQHTLSSSAADVAFYEERSPEAGILDAMIGVQEIQKKLQNGQNGFPKVTEKGSRPVICINSGGDCLSRASGSYDFSADAFFTGGEVIRADDRFGEEEGPSDNCEQCTCNAQKQVSKFKEEYERLQKEQEENNRTLERLKKENEFKDRECQKARMSLQELHNELMRKSMHVGSLVSRHADLGREHEDLKAKFVKATREQKQLYNKIVEMKGNIRVFCRCRPLSKEEIEAGSSTAVDFESAKDGEVTVRTNGGTKKLFKYDAVFSPQASQAEVFEETAPFAASVLDGYNVCIFAYGQTGTGKTFTMEGTEESRGVNYRTLNELFRIIGERDGLLKYELSVSVLEVYNEHIRDLLASTSQPGQAAKRLEIRQEADGIHHVPGLVEAQVNNMDEVEKAKQDMKAKDDQIKKMEDTILSMGLKMRARDSTNKSLQERVKELEAQLVIERKLSRQHVDSKVAERQAVQQQAVRPPLPVRQFGNQKATEPFPLSRDLLNVMQPCSENNRVMKQLQESLIESKTGDLKWNLGRAYATPIQKENKVDILEQQPFIKRTGRASICGTAQRIPMVRVPRRTSLIPLPSVRNTGLPLLPLTTPQRPRVQLTPLGKIDPIEESTPRSFRGNKNNHRLSIVLRKSIQMKMKLKSPLHHHKEMDKARVSVGGKLRLAQRVLISDLRGPKFVQQRQQEKVKERGWNRRASMKNLTG
ncbi:Kinesin-4 [Nymphaea thermarum]|nr:Kinesin-4 [Nymphaea thermarum]